ncbi:hypothetical protein DFH09DRAFT_1100888 [Mycena vulgaris]|nr:hypothetical protein DFH09DRAFT_1100888 [Mycena vulgaris]
MNTTPTAISAANPAEELAALIAHVSALSKLALSMTKHCIEIHDAIPKVVASQVAAALAGTLLMSIAFMSMAHIADRLQLAPAPQFIEGGAITPANLAATHPPGHGDHQSWTEADAQVNGVPGQFRQKKASRVEALSFYRSKFNTGEVTKLTEITL